MKKLLFSLCALGLLLVLSGCGGPKGAMSGPWIDLDSGNLVVFNKDNTFTQGESTYEYAFAGNGDVILFTDQGAFRGEVEFKKPYMIITTPTGRVSAYLQIEAVRNEDRLADAVDDIDYIPWGGTEDDLYEFKGDVMEVGDREAQFDVEAADEDDPLPAPMLDFDANPIVGEMKMKAFTTPDNRFVLISEDGTRSVVLREHEGD